jgi:DNA-binding NtrC family response regulator
LGRPAAGITREAHERLLAHSWPGNVRELRNAVERALILSDGRMITPEHLPAPPESPRESAPPRESLDLETTERELVERALRHAGQNKAKAARLLGLTRTKLYTRMQRFGLS